ncbi:LysR family transcriptional regulator [Brotaphodocola catenula]|mgnify:FL=1|uniref:LysR family transcriptional regulator n=1 Tax=Brotaphodocola catenula TaxID=2885361 RepID=A0AAE3DIM1_9FIRM|nr:LysR family transcriptional regulator [Brotaphodocola catenula]MCC2163609.1 LysR family transcriptional regulator [Brotaphodocola catenula]
MEIKQLEYFRAIVEAGTISGAARELHMTQPPLSYQIKMMEEELKVSLFLRGTKRITLTEAGKTLYEQAEKILTLTELTKSEVLKSSQATTLHIGMTPSTVSMMSDYLQQFARRYPQIRFDIHEGSTFTLKEQIENQQVDITTLRTPIALSGCEVKSLAKERLLAMAIPEYPLFEGKTSVSLRELIDQPLILSRRYQKYMLSVFEKAGVTQNIYCACEDARTALVIAEKGLGIAILPASMLKQSEKLKAWEIKDADLATEILLVWRKGRVPVEVKKFLEMMEEAKEG